MEEEQIPIFVYGTLRYGEWNHNSCLGQTYNKAEVATLSGYAMLNLGLFPAIIPNDEGTVLGELYWLRPDMYGGILNKLDWLEGHQYDRVKLTVDVGGRRQVAWVYVASKHLNKGRCYQLIPSGDWVGHFRQ